MPNPTTIQEGQPMNEIEKMYKNAEVESCCTVDLVKALNNIIICNKKCLKCSYNEYPKFTAEKQIELIKWLGKRPLALLISRYKGKYYFGNSNFSSKADNFDNAIAIRINDLWQSLTDTEKAEIKRILE